MHTKRLETSGKANSGVIPRIVNFVSADVQSANAWTQTASPFRNGSIIGPPL